MTTDDAHVEITRWEALGEYRTVLGYRILTMSLPASERDTAEPLLVLHGFPTSSYDFHAVLDELRRDRAVHLVDFLGYGLSDKPDRAYTMSLQADIVVSFLNQIGLARFALLTHDMGDTVGGELLARVIDGTWEADVTRRVVTNGSIYIDMAHLSAGQQLLLSLPDERLGDDGLVDAAAVGAGVAATFSAQSHVDAREVDVIARFVTHHDGHRILPRLIRYIEERRRDERRFTGAIEAHPSPLAIVWGADDPIAVVEMSGRLHRARPDASLTVLDGVGHYPMVEAPERFAAAVTAAFSRRG
jgi:pimeloyl-ACP methyl ester carboxylesterase